MLLLVAVAGLATGAVGQDMPDRPPAVLSDNMAGGMGNTMAGNPLCPRPMKIAWFDNRPYHYRNTDGAITGLDVEVLAYVLTRIGCRYEFSEMPLKRLLNGIRDGRVDAVMGASRTPDRDDYALFSAPFRRELMAMFMRAGEETRFHPKTLTEVVDANLTLGVVIGSWYGNEFDRLFQENEAFRARVLQASDADMLFRGLKHGRVDIVVDDLFSGVDKLRLNGELATTAVHARLVNDDVTHFMFSRKTVPTALLDQFNAALKDYEQSPAFVAVTRKYVPQDYLHFVPVHQASPLLPDRTGETETATLPAP
ncbi:MAG: transporter substrate-binding domain-containing protein [Alphaproteobacteria bacterium]|nr:MAG: transporter substrate-binding domain-containing protein [Alphaproteobacteria bacterium]